MGKPEKHTYGMIRKWLFFIAFSVLFAVDLWLVATGRIQHFDDAVIDAVLRARSDELTLLFKAITFCGDSWTMAGLCILIIALPSRLKIGIPVSLAIAVGALVQLFIKDLIARPRPDEVNWLVEVPTYSFPSGHSYIGMVFWVALLLLLGRVLLSKGRMFAAVLLGICFVVFAILIGFSRLYLGVHYLSDIMGGWLFAGAYLCIVFAIYDNIWPVKWRVPASPFTGS